MATSSLAWTSLETLATESSTLSTSSQTDSSVAGCTTSNSRTSTAVLGVEEEGDGMGWMATTRWTGGSALAGVDALEQSRR